MDDREPVDDTRPDTGDTPPAHGVGDSPLRPGEREMYATDQAAGSGLDDEDGGSVAAEPRPWLLVGIALLVAFLAILAWAVVDPLLSVVTVPFAA